MVKVSGYLSPNCAALLISHIEFRLEWSKAYARKARWSEEVKLLKEEMRRVLEFLKWKSTDWFCRGDH